MRDDPLAGGMIFRAPYPFLRDTVTLFNEDGCSEVATWKPGVRDEWIAPDDTEAVADGVGEIILTIVSVHKPGRFPVRVFFTRRWRSPDGKEFGKNGCRCVISAKFRRLANGYAHEFVVRDSAAQAA